VRHSVVTKTSKTELGDVTSTVALSALRCPFDKDKAIGMHDSMLTYQDEYSEHSIAENFCMHYYKV
jgi:hypothetical protein